MHLHRFLKASVFFIGLFCVPGLAKADAITWNTWTSNSHGTMGAVGVTYSSMDTHALVAGYPSYSPHSTFADGVIVNNAPDPLNSIMQIRGGSDAINTVTFSTAVINPVMAIWSLGAGGTPAEFVFPNETPHFVSGGPSNEYGGSSIIVNGNVVSGIEGNGTIQFLGTYTSLEFTNPLHEDWYGFNVGIAGIASPVPEPSTFALLGLGGVGIVVGAIRRRHRATVA